MFRSKIIKVEDFRTIEIFDLPTQALEVKNKIIQSLSKVVNKYSEYEEVADYVKKGDLVTLNLASATEKFNKKSLPVVVGSNLFNSSFEEQIVNMIPNQMELIKLNGDIIETIVTKIERKKIPELTDELIREENIDSVLTVEDYKDYLFDTIVSQQVSEVAEKVIDRVMEISEFEISKEDINRLFEGDVSKMTFLSQEEGKVLEEMTEMEIGQRIGEPSLAAFEVEYKNNRYPNYLKRALIGLSIAQDDNVTFNESTYESSFESSEYYKNYSLSESKKLFPYFNYLTYSYSAYAHEKIAGFFKEAFEQNKLLVK